MECYVYQTKDAAGAALAAINQSGWFPVVGLRGGKENPDAPTTCWVSEPTELPSGEWAIPRIPEYRLEQIGVPQADRDAFLLAFGRDIRMIEPVEGDV